MGDLTLVILPRALDFDGSMASHPMGQMGGHEHGTVDTSAVTGLFLWIMLDLGFQQVQDGSGWSDLFIF